MGASHKEHVDVCIIGGGIIGLSIAANLAREGLAIRLIDKQYSGSSRDNFGHISLHGHPKPLHGFATFCYEAWQRASYEWECDLGLNQSGSLMLAQTEDEQERLVKDHESAEKQGEDSQWNDDIKAVSEALGEVTLPEDAKSIRLAPKDYVIETRVALENIRKMLVQQGVRIWGQDAVKHFLLAENGAIRGVETDNGDICMAGQTIVCTGVHTQALVKPLGIHMPLRPARAHLMELSPSGNVPVPYMTKLYPRGVLRMRKTTSGRMLVAYDGVLEQNEAVWDKTVNAERLTWVREQAASLLPCLQEAAMQEERAVLQSISPDFMPYIGAYEGKNGLLFATGMNGRSYAFAAGVAEIMTAFVCGKAPPVNLEAVQANRFHNGKGAGVKLESILPTYQPEPEDEGGETDKKEAASSGEAVAEKTTSGPVE